MSNYGLSLRQLPWGKKPPKDEICVVSTCSWDQTNWVYGMTLQPFTEPVIANFSVPSHFLVKGHVSEQGTLHPILILSFFNTWLLRLEKRKTLRSVMDGFQKRQYRQYVGHIMQTTQSRTYNVDTIMQTAQSRTHNVDTIM